MLSTGPHGRSPTALETREMKTVKVLIADDHRLMLTGVRRALDDADDIEVVDEVELRHAGAARRGAHRARRPPPRHPHARASGSSLGGSAAATRTCA